MKPSRFIILALLAGALTLLGCGESGNGNGGSAGTAGSGGNGSGGSGGVAISAGLYSSQPRGTCWRMTAPITACWRLSPSCSSCDRPSAF